MIEIGILPPTHLALHKKEIMKYHSLFWHETSKPTLPNTYPNNLNIH